MSHLIRHLRANLVAYLALFVALGGTSYAALRLPSNSVGSKQIARNAVRNSDLANNSVTSRKVKDRSLLAVDFAAGQLPAGSPGAPGAPGAPGSPGSPGAPGSAFAYARVDENGVLDAANSKNIAVHRAPFGTGVYCLQVTGGTPHNAQATIDVSHGDSRNSAAANIKASGNIDPGLGCNAEDNVEVFTINQLTNPPTAINNGFFVEVN